MGLAHVIQQLLGGYVGFVGVFVVHHHGITWEWVKTQYL